MTDFYTQLEEQLVTAGRRRAGRGAVRRAVAGRRPQLLAATALVAVVIAAASILPSVLSSSDGGAGAPAPKPAPAGPLRTPAAASLKGIRVTVLNATTTPGVARDVATQLLRRGATIVEVGDGQDQTLEHSAVRWRGQADAEARRVALLLGVARMAMVASDEPSAADVLVLVGADGVRVDPGRAVPTSEQVAAIAARVHRLSRVTCNPGRGSFSWTCSARKGTHAWLCAGGLRSLRPRDLVLRCMPDRAGR